MTAAILDGKAMAGTIRAEIAEQAARFTRESGVTPCLAAVLVGDDAASQVYVRGKRKACEAAGMRSELLTPPATTTTEELLDLVGRLNDDPAVHGILVQLPLPESIDELRVLDAVRPEKDVDAFHPHNVGLISQGRPRFLPCTPHGIQQLLVRSGMEIAGAEVVVLGRSDIVGKPMMLMLAQKAAGANATVTLAHSLTRNLPEVCRRADILIVAIGRAKFLTADMVKPGATVVDVGINRTESGLVGDVDFDAVREVAGHITPVPGGVGPLTIAMLLKNTLEAARLQTG